MMRIFSLLLLLSITNVSFALNPVREYATTPGDYGMDYNTIHFKTEDGLELQGWFFKATDRSSRKVIILSDDGNGNMADLIELASNFLSLGYYVFTYDYRGFGKSQDFEIKKNFFIYNQFEKDLNAAITYVKKDWASLKTIHLYGTGIGAGLSIGVGAKRPEVSKVIADSPYLTFDLTQKRYEEVYGQKVLMPLGFDKTLMEPKYSLESSSGLVGVLIISGSEDPIFTPDDLKELGKIKKKITKTQLIEGANRISTFTTDKAAYFETIKDFLKL